MISSVSIPKTYDLRFDIYIIVIYILDYSMKKLPKADDPMALRALTQLTPLVQSKSFNELGQTYLGFVWKRARNT